MTASRAPAEPEVREFETVVDRVDGPEVVLGETYFYAESGGQPADRGTIDGVLVEDVQAVDGEVVHTLAAEPDLAAGDRVACVVDDAFRTYCMRAHTASHVLYGAARRLFDDLGYAGFDIGTEKVRVDLTTEEPIDDAALVELGRLSNRAVWDSLPVAWERLPAAEAREKEGIAFNTKTEEGAMSGGDDVRVVTVGGASDRDADLTGANDRDADLTGANDRDVDPWDVAACGGTHVSNTAEIGPIEVLERSNPGEGRTRVEFAVGPSGIDRDAAVHGAALDAASALGASLDDLPDAVERLREERDRLESEVRDLEAELLGSRLADLPRVERDGATWAVGTVEGFGPNDVSDPLKGLVGDDGPAVAAVVGEEGSPFVVVASTGGVDAGDVVSDATAAFGGGGGGGPTFAQGGGLEADPETVVAWLRGE